MSETKREWLPLYSFYDRSGVAHHLEEMAAEGWMLESLGTYSWRYRRMEPKKLHFSVTYFPTASQFDSHPSVDQETFWDFCAAAGWELATSSAQVQIFYNEQENPIPLETDPASEYNNIKRSMRRGPITSYLLLLALCVFELLFGFWRLWNDPVDTLSSSASLSASFGWTPLLLLVCVELIRAYRWMKRAKTAADANLPLPDLRSAKGLGLLVLIVTALEFLWILLSSLQTSRRMLFVILAVLVVFALMFFLSHMVLNAAKKLRFSRWVNMALTLGVIVLMSIGMMAGMMAVIFRLDGNLLEDHPPVESYEYEGMTWDVYADPLPLTIEELINTDYDQWSTRLIQDSSLLLTQLQASQRPRMDALEQPDLRYEMVIVHAPFLYNLCKNDFINWLERDNDKLPEEHWDLYKPVDSAPWGANEVYQRYSGGEFYNQFLVCWNDRIVEIHFEWDWEITDELIAITAGELKHS